MSYNMRALIGRLNPTARGVMEGGGHTKTGHPVKGAPSEVPATAYSPAPSRAEYHRRCRA